MTSPVSTRAAQRSDSSRKSAGSNRASARPSSKAWGPRSIRFWLSAFSMMTLRAFERADQPRQQVGPAPAGHQPEEALRQRDGRDAGGDRPVGAVQRDLDPAAHGRPVDERERGHVQLAEPAEDGVPELPEGPGLVPARRSRPTPLRSAPTAKMNGLPVTPTAAISPRWARPATASRAPLSSSRPAGPNVLGLVWSKPLSRVIRASVPAPSGRSTSRTYACVTTSSGNRALISAGSPNSVVLLTWPRPSRRG